MDYCHIGVTPPFLLSWIVFPKEFIWACYPIITYLTQWRSYSWTSSASSTACHVAWFLTETHCFFVDFGRNYFAWVALSCGWARRTILRRTAKQRSSTTSSNSVFALLFITNQLLGANSSIGQSGLITLLGIMDQGQHRTRLHFENSHLMSLNILLVLRQWMSLTNFWPIGMPSSLKSEISLSKLKRWWRP